MITGAADSHKLVSHFADCVVVGGHGAVSWDCDIDVLSMHWSVCSFVSNNGIAGGHRCGAPRLSGFGGFRKTAVAWCKVRRARHDTILLHTSFLLGVGGRGWGYVCCM